MSRASFARARERDSRGRFVDCHRSSTELLFDPTGDEARPMAILGTRTGLKGLFERVLVAFLVLFGRKIPLTLEKSSIPIGIENRFITSGPLDQTDPTGDDENESKNK